MSIRKAGNRSRFYPYSEAQIESMIVDWEKERNDSPSLNNTKKACRGAIVPHAGYIYSGYTACCAYKEIQRCEFERIIVVGPSHHFKIEGISISEFDRFETPYGELTIDRDYIENIKKNFIVDFQDKAHFYEHSTETQMPFIKKFFPDTRVVEIIYGYISPDSLFELFAFILNDQDNFLIISTDLSHFHNLKLAQKTDSETINALLKNDCPMMEKSGEACGKTGLLALMKYLSNSGLEVSLLDYRTSENATSDKSRVVGYMSAVF
ncbi:MAG: AmmeMemoRadiSam system protein B [Deltaproteobacteria bacterium]